MNWSRKHLNKVRKEIAEWYKENNEEQLSELVSIATSKKDNHYFQRNYYPENKRYYGYYCTSVVGGNQYHSLKELD